MNDFILASSPIQPHLQSLLVGCREQLIIASPYITRSAVEWLVQVKQSTLKRLSLLTNVSLANIINKSLDLGALRLFLSSFDDVSIVSLPNLHAKVFVADIEVAFVTSANFTNGGLWTNYEYGILVSDRQVVRQIAQDMNAYMLLGGSISDSLLNQVEQKAQQLAAFREQVEADPATRELKKKVRQSQIELQNKLLINRLGQGRTINGLFTKTIVWLLERHPNGMTTPQLHQQIQFIHPDICDDSIDRVIDGQHFGKRWKHYVRRAQEYLKEKGKIRNIDGIWSLS